jgi:cytochrome c5
MARENQMRLHILVAIGILQCGLLLPAQTPAPAPQNNQAKPSPQHPGYTLPPTASDNPGEKKFRQNCSRCHSAPEELSPRIAGTVLMHMRVRASLSAADERDILRYLAP